MPRSLPGVLLVGCDELVDDGAGWACELEPGSEPSRSVRVWIPAGSEPRLRVDAVERDPARTREVDGGALLDVELASGATELAIERPGPEGVERWAVSLRWRDPGREPRSLDRAKEAMFTAFGEERWEDCQYEAERVRRQARDEGRGLTELRALQNGIMCSLARGEPGQARALATALAQLPGFGDEREVMRAYLDGVVLRSEGAMHESIVALRRGLVLSERLGMTSRHAEHLSMLSLVLAELGDVEGAVAASEAALDRRAHPYVHECEQAALRTNLAWVSMLGIEVGLAERVPDPAAELQRALDAYRGPQAPCAHEEAAANVGLNLARAALLRADSAEAEAWLAQVTEPIERSTDAHLREELRLLHAQLRLGQGRVDEARDELARTSDRPDLAADLRLARWVLQGELAEHDGDWEAARALYRRAHELPLLRASGLSHEEGRLRFIYDRLRGSQHLVALLVGPLGDPAGALAVARDAAGREARLLADRHRALHPPIAEASVRAARDHYLDARDRVEQALVDRWDLTPEARHDLRERARAHERAQLVALLAAPGSPEVPAPLATPGPGELWLAYFPRPGGGRLAFAATQDGVQAIELSPRALPLQPVDPRGSDPWRRAWAEHLLVPLGDAIDRAERIRVLPSFGIESLPFHALPWRDRPLLAHAEVWHSLDLPPGSRPVAQRSGRALVVGDPQGDLADARIEAEQVAAALAGRGLAVDLRFGHEATGPSIRHALPEVGLLHYAGHAASAGAFGWESTLGLAADGRLDVGDLFALDRVPAQVVLTACRSGAPAAGPRERGISLAEAFVIAGADAVLAASIDLSAAEVASLGPLVHEGERGPGHDLRSAHRRAMLRWHEEVGTSVTWQALRLWVP